jgi:excisionase family DNA binding protein
VDGVRNVLWTTNEAAMVLGVTPVTIYRRIGAGKLESVLVGGRRMVPHRAILAEFAGLLSNPDTRDATIRLIRGHAELLGKTFDGSAFERIFEEDVPLQVTKGPAHAEV